MKFDELDQRMRIFETAHDHCVLPGIYIVARLDGRGFTRLTKKIHKFNAPFDERMRDYMVSTLEHLMNCGLKINFGYTQSDEISLLFDLEENGFKRKVRKLNSVLAGEASAKFSLLLGDMGCFDCRISQLPNLEEVVEYFRWRNEDAYRNALNSHVYWRLRQDNKSASKATTIMDGLSVAEKNELLWQYGINFNVLPNWQKRGVGIYWEKYEKVGYNPVENCQDVKVRSRLYKDFNLPMKDDYSQFIRNLTTQ